MKTIVPLIALLVGCSGSEERFIEMQTEQTRHAKHRVIETPNTYIIDAREDACISQAYPDAKFDGGPGCVGASTESILSPDGVLKERIGHPDRYIVRFPYTDLYQTTEIIGLTLVVQILSGTCQSSYNNKRCNRPLEVQVYSCDLPYIPEQELTWNNAPQPDGEPLATFTIKEDYMEPGSVPKEYRVDVSAALRSWPDSDYILSPLDCVLLKATPKGELVGLSSDDMKENQTDVVIGSRDTVVGKGDEAHSLPLRLEVAHKSDAE